MISQYLLW